MWDSATKQGNSSSCGGYTINKTFTFPLSYSNTAYGIVGSSFWMSNYAGCYVYDKTITGFKTGSNSHNSGTIGWLTIGY